MADFKYTEGKQNSDFSAEYKQIVNTVPVSNDHFSLRMEFMWLFKSLLQAQAMYYSYKIGTCIHLPVFSTPDHSEVLHGNLISPLVRIVRVVFQIVKRLEFGGNANVVRKNKMVLKDRNTFLLFITSKQIATPSQPLLIPKKLCRISFVHSRMRDHQDILLWQTSQGSKTNRQNPARK